MTQVVSFSGGTGSWAAARRVVERHGADDTVLLFADTLIEDEDLYRFIDEAAADVGAPLVRIADGRDPWDVFFERRFLGNTRVDLCSRILKRELLRRWLEDNTDPETTTVHVGIDWTETHRLGAIATRYAPWSAAAPLADPPYLLKAQIHADLEERGIEIPELYRLGFAHNNCGGFCVKAGQAQFALLLRVRRERYLYHERREQELRAYLGKDVAILRDRRGGKTRPLTLRDFRLRLEEDATLFDADEWGGCGCVA